MSEHPFKQFCPCTLCRIEKFRLDLLAVAIKHNMAGLAFNLITMANQKKEEPS